MATHSITHAGFASHNHTGGRLEQNGFGWFAVARETGYVISVQMAGDAVKTQHGSLTCWWSCLTMVGRIHVAKELATSGNKVTSGCN